MQTSQATATSAESALGIARSTERDLRSECEAAHGQIREFTSIIAALKLDRDDFKDKLSNLESKYADQCNNHKHRERELDQHASSLSAELENVKNKLAERLLRSFSDDPNEPPAEYPCRLCAESFVDHKALEEHIQDQHHGITEYRKKLFALVEDVGPKAVPREVQRRIIAAFDKELLQPADDERARRERLCGLRAPFLAARAEEGAHHCRTRSCSG